MTDVLVSENVGGEAMDALRQRFDVAFEPELWRDATQLAARIAGCRSLIVRNQTRVTADLLAAADAVCVIGRAGAGLDNIDVAAASDAGIVVTSTPDQNAVSVAEMTIGLMLCLARRLCAADASTRAGGWERQAFTGVELYRKTLGVLGLGRIGFLTAMRARAFGMDVCAHDPFVRPDSGIVTELRARLVGRDELAAMADFVVCHLPAGAGTRHSVDAAWLGRMKPTACFINTSRGEVVDEDALLEALVGQRIAGAALDVRGREPAGRDAFADLPNVVLTPHIAAFTKEAQRRVVATVCHDVSAVLRGEPALHFANFPLPRR